MMKKLFALSVILIAFTAVAFSQVSATATATATIVTPITISLTGTNLSFGNIVPDNSSDGWVTIDWDGTPHYSAEVSYTASPTLTAARTAAVFTVTGTPNASYRVTLPLANVALNGPTGSTAMNAHAFTSNLDTNSRVGQLSNPAGTQELRVGATLTVAGGQASGPYTGSFSVTVEYD